MIFVEIRGKHGVPKGIRSRACTRPCSAERHGTHGHADGCLNGLDDRDAEMRLQRRPQRGHAGASEDDNICAVLVTKACADRAHAIESETVILEFQHAETEGQIRRQSALDTQAADVAQMTGQR